MSEQDENVVQTGPASELLLSSQVILNGELYALSALEYHHDRH